MGTTNTRVGGPGGAGIYALNSVKFDPSTAGTCPNNTNSAAQCNLIGNPGEVFRIEALGQNTFDFGVDSNNAHVQPNGEYHYHGMPEGLLTALGTTSANPRMTLVGWASDGFPVYARYCHTVAMDPASPLKLCAGSFVRDTTADSGRPSPCIYSPWSISVRLELRSRVR
jgi:YHYH protein